jgi:hypothetical protein
MLPSSLDSASGCIRRESSGLVRLACRSNQEGADERMLRLAGLSVTRAPCEPSSRLFGDDSREPRATLMFKVTG